MGDMIMCAQGWPKALGSGWGRNPLGTVGDICGNFFLLPFWPPAVTGFDKRRNNKVEKLLITVGVWILVLA